VIRDRKLIHVNAGQALLRQKKRYSPAPPGHRDRITGRLRNDDTLSGSAESIGKAPVQ